MKAGLFVAAALTPLAIAQPHHHFRHQHLHEKRVDVVTKVDVVTATAPDVVVFVNQFGEPISTSFVNAVAQKYTATAAHPDHHVSHSIEHHSTHPVASPTTLSTSSTPAVVYTPPPPPPAKPTTTAAPPPPPPPPSSTTTSPPASSSPSSSGPSSSGGFGLTYSPYNADGTCKTQTQVTNDFEQLSGYGLVRMYGVDCAQLNTVGSAAVAKGMKLFLGVYYLSSLADEIASIVAYANGDWSNIETISIGNELVNSNQASVAEVVAAVGVARGLLQAAGYKGPVVTVDTFTAVLNNPELCQASDYAAINAHAFFDPDTTASQAGSWASGIADQVKKACNKAVVVTESGWPSEGDTNGVAVPSEANQKTAISSLKANFPPNGIILFNAYNDLWKTNFDGSFGAEQYWGIYGTSSQ